MPSEAFAVFESNRRRVEDVLSFHPNEREVARGAPPVEARSLVPAAHALLYGAWESYIELVAVETVAHLALHLEPAAVPISAIGAIESAAGTPWKLAGNGWRDEWAAAIKDHALGDGNNNYGLNTAKPHQVIKMFEIVGLDPFDQVGWQNMSVDDVKGKLAALVVERGEIVHKAQAPDGFNLNSVREYRDFLNRLVPNVDASLRRQVVELDAPMPWQLAG